MKASQEQLPSPENVSIFGLGGDLLLALVLPSDELEEERLTDRFLDLLIWADLGTVLSSSPVRDASLSPTSCLIAIEPLLNDLDLYTPPGATLSIVSAI